MNILQTMENPRHHGPITTLCLDRKKSWVLAGTVTGVLTLWDLRFGLLLKSWKVAAAASSPKSPRIHQCVIHPSKGKGRWVIVALESRQESAKDGAMVLEVWDIEKTLLVESFVVRSSEATGAGVGDTPDVSSSTLGAEADTSPAAAIAALVRSRQRHGHLYTRHTSAGEVVGPPSPQIRAIIAGLDFGGYTPAHRADPSDGGSDQGGRTRAHRGFMVSGSEDRMIRLWDLAKVERTVILSAPTAEGDKPVYQCDSSFLSRIPISLTYPADSSANAPDNSSTHFESWPASARRGTHLPPQRIALINASQQDLLRAHQDTITALACIDAPFRGGIVSGDRAGVIKVWRVDGTD
jgi:phosphoinositide-3-kinase, regulatory subunit 4